MSTPHTPGPWTINPILPSTVNHLLFEEPLDDRNVVCRMPNRNPESEANARLIAAAPDLLLALNECASVLDSANRHTNGRCMAFIMSLEKARAAIAKATHP